MIIDADVDAAGRWVCTTYHRYFPRVVFNDQEFKVDCEGLQLGVRWLDSGHFLLFDARTGWCAVCDLDGRQVRQFSVGTDVDEVLVTSRHLTVTYRDDDEGWEDDPMTSQTANVFDHAGVHHWGYRDRFGDAIDASPISVIEGADRIALGCRNAAALARIDLATGVRTLIDLPEEMRGDSRPTYRGGAYYFAKNPKSQFLGTFVWSPRREEIGWMTGGGFMARGARRGLPGGRAITWINELLWIVTIPRTEFEHTEA